VALVEQRQNEIDDPVRRSLAELAGQADDPAVDRGELRRSVDRFIGEHRDFAPAQEVRERLKRERNEEWNALVNRYEDPLDDLKGLEAALASFANDHDAERVKKIEEMTGQLAKRSEAARTLIKLREAFPQDKTERATARKSLESIWRQNWCWPHSEQAKNLLGKMADEDWAPLAPRASDATIDRDALIRELNLFLWRFPTLPQADQARAMRLAVWTQRGFPWDKLKRNDITAADESAKVGATLVGQLDLAPAKGIDEQRLQVSISHDGTMLAVCQEPSGRHNKGIVSVWNLSEEQPKELARINDLTMAGSIGSGTEFGFHFPMTSERLLVPVGYSVMQEWNWKEKPKTTERPRYRHGDGGFVQTGPTGNLAVFLDSPGDTYLIVDRRNSGSSGSIRIPYNPSESQIGLADVHLGRSLIAVCTFRTKVNANSKLKNVTIWDVTWTYAPKQIKEIYPDGWPWHLAFSPSGDDLAMVANTGIVFQSLGKGPSFTLAQENVRTIAFSPDGKRLAAGGEDNRLVVWDIPQRTRQIEIELPAGRETQHVAFTPDGRYLVSAHDDGTVRIYRLSAGP
jgi:WD40 repeat protein